MSDTAYVTAFEVFVDTNNPRILVNVHGKLVDGDGALVSEISESIEIDARDTPNQVHNQTVDHIASGHGLGQHDVVVLAPVPGRS